MIQTFPSTLVTKQEIAPSVYLLTFQLDKNAPELIFKAGQYLILKVPKDGTFVSRLFSIASAAVSSRRFELIVKFEPYGIASTYLEALSIGETVAFQGPAGFFTIKNPQQNKIFLITGTGIAPVRSMLLEPKQSLDPKTQNYLFWGVPTYKDLYLVEEFVKLEQDYPNFHLYFCLSRESTLHHIPSELHQKIVIGRATQGFEDKLLATNYQLIDTDFYLCGNRDVVEFLREYTHEKGVEKERIIFEKF